MARYLIAAGFLALMAGGVMTACSTVPSLDGQAVVDAAAAPDLVLAIEAGDEKRVAQWVSRGGPVNVRTPTGSALDLAAGRGLDGAVITMLRAGADPDVGRPEGVDSALHYYAERGQVKMLKTLAAAGADLEYTTADGRTALAVAVVKGHLSASKALIKAGADVNTEFAGRSLLMHVVATNSLLMTQLLIDAGANVNYRNAAGESALDVANTGNLQDVRLLLLHSGAQ